MRIAVRYRRLDGTLAVVASGSGDTVRLHDVSELGRITRLDALDFAKRLREAS